MCVCYFMIADCNYIQQHTQALEFAERTFWYSCINRNLQNFIKLLTVMSGLMDGF